MNWHLAPALVRLREQVNERWPSRSKESDGSIGNAEHSARESDHNPNDSGVVCAIDITHDPKSGCDSYALAEDLLASRDPRIEYVISNHKIASSHVQPWSWRKYNGKNPHDHHVHISVKQDPKRYDDGSSWNLDAKPMPAPKPSKPDAPSVLRKGSTGQAVKELQTALRANGLNTVKIDGTFGVATETAVKTFQKASGLVVDGIAGPQTQAALKKEKVI